MQRRKFAGLVAGVAVGMSAALSVAPTGAQVVTPPGAETVTVEGGPARLRDFAPACSDVFFLGIEERLSFVLTRSGPATTPMAVAYRLSGSAQPGVHYGPLPGWAMFPAGEATIEVEVTPRTTPFGGVVTLTLETMPRGSSATITFVSPAEPGPHECGYRFTDDEWNTWQSIPLGGTPHPLTVEGFTPPAYTPAAGVFRLVWGALPDGVGLAEDGSFTGAATAPGATRSLIEACRPQPPGTCITTNLLVVVEPGTGPPTPPPPTPPPPPPPVPDPPLFSFPFCLPWLPPEWQSAC